MRILLADDQALFRESFALVLQHIFPDSTLTNVCSWPELAADAKQNNYDLLLVDLLMPGSDVWHTSLLHVTESQNEGVTCIVSSSSNPTYIRQAFACGASGYISKTYTLEKVRYALDLVCSGKTYLPGQLRDSSTCTSGKPVIKLTWRQKEILELAATGDSNKVIGSKLGLAESTVKRHLYGAYRSLQAKNRVDAIKIARQEGILFF